jgi:alginate O-acetyltransferase complex protein AlgJ
METTHGAEHVHVGRDGWLFLTAGSNNVVGQFSRSRLMARRVRGWRRLVVARVRGCERLGCRYLHVIVPEKLTVYDHKLSEGLRVKVRLSPALRLRRALFWHRSARRACLDLVGAFRAVRDARDLYFRTDSHWSFAGCDTAYRLICAACGAVPKDLSGEPQEWRQMAGDLGSKLTPPQSERWPIRGLQRDAVRVHASPIVELRERTGRADKLHVGAHVIYRNDAAGTDPRRVVLFGDSYAHFAPIMLTALIAETFAEVHFVWSSSLDWGYVERVRPDLVIGQVAERFMFELPDDRFDLEAYAAERFGTELAEAEAKSARKPGKNPDRSPGKKPGKAGTSVAGP